MVEIDCVVHQRSIAMYRGHQGAARTQVWPEVDDVVDVQIARQSAQVNARGVRAAREPPPSCVQGGHPRNGWHSSSQVQPGAPRSCAWRRAAPSGKGCEGGRGSKPRRGPLQRATGLGGDQIEGQGSSARHSPVWR